MPISITVDEPTRRMVVTARGIVSHADVVDYLTQRRDRGLLGHATLIDCGQADTDLTAQQIRDLTTRRRRIQRGHVVGPTALVAERDLLFGMLRMYQILMEDGVSLHVVRTCAEAERWLDEATGTPDR
ncbi:MAG: hypothetical protein JO180_12485 [Gemmatirosa sp.]|nr:hypothetical protein [Gemmatirosa sp.]